MRVLRLSLVVIFIALAALFGWRVQVNHDRTVSAQVAACERGNVIRERIARIEARLADQLDGDEPILVPFPCNRLR